MHQLIGIAIAFAVALTLAVMPAAESATLSTPSHSTTIALTSPSSRGFQINAAVAVPNFISYRDRSGATDATNASAPGQPSGPANTEPADDNDPTGLDIPDNDVFGQD